MSNDASAKQEFLTSADAAKLLNLTPAAIRLAALTNRLQVAAVTAGGVRLFTRTDVEAFKQRRHRRESAAA